MARRSGILLATILVALLSAFLSPRSALAQADFSRLPEGSHIEYHDAGNKPLVFTSTTVYVLVPVIVTDKNGNHVSGLTQDAFRVVENGKEQKINSFEEIKPSEAPVPVQHRDLSKNLFSNVPAGNETKPRRLVILAADLVNTPLLDQALMRQAITTYLADNIDPDALYELVAIDSNGLHVIHEFTQDTAGLVAGLKHVKERLTSGDTTVTAAVNAGRMVVNPKPAGGGPIATTPATANSDPGPTTVKINVGAQDDEFIMGMLAQAERPVAELLMGQRAAVTLLAMQQIAQRVSGVPGRKSLVWITGGFPFSIDPVTGSNDVSISAPAYEHTMQLLADHMISVYPVDARGLLHNQAEAGTHMGVARTMTMDSWLADESSRQNVVLDTMRTFADLTGGRAFVNNNDTRGAIRRAAADGASYYLLSYAVDKTNRRPGWRKISVKVPNYTVRARPGYFMTQATADPALMAKMDIDTALTSPFEYTGLPVRVSLAQAADAGDKRKITFAMTMPPKAAQVDSADRNHLNVAIAYLVQTREGKSAGQKGTSYNLNLDAAQLQQIETKGVGYGDTLELPPGDYTLKLVVRDNISGRMGSVTAPLVLK